MYFTKALIYNKCFFFNVRMLDIWKPFQTDDVALEVHVLFYVSSTVAGRCQTTCKATTQQKIEVEMLAAL